MGRSVAIKRVRGELRKLQMARMMEREQNMGVHRGRGAGPSADPVQAPMLHRLRVHHSTRAGRGRQNIARLHNEDAQQ